jgi:hypothetical protein
MKILLSTFITICFIGQMYAQHTERFYTGTNGKKIKEKGQSISLETCDDDSYLSLDINESSREVESESKKYKGSCSTTGNDVQLSDKGVLKTRLAQFADTLVLSKYEDNGRLMYQKSIVKSDISRFQQKVIPYEKGGFVASYITYPKDNGLPASVGYIIFDANGVEKTRKTVDEPIDAAPFSQLIDGPNETDFYVLQGTNATCGQYKLHKIVGTNKVWTANLKYDFNCDNLQFCHQQQW